MIYKCIKLFNILPTMPLYKWLIAADWIQEEQNIEITANAFREGIFTLEVNEGVYRLGDGSGNGTGDGLGFGYGCGLRNRDVDDGNGFGGGYGRGDGYGNGI